MKRSNTHVHTFLQAQKSLVLTVSHYSTGADGLFAQFIFRRVFEFKQIASED